MFSNRGGKGILSNRFGKKGKKDDESNGVGDPEELAKGMPPKPGGGMQRQGSWIAGGMPAPPTAVVQEVKAKNIQVKKEAGAATNIQSKIRQKNAKVQIEGKRQARKEENAATRIQAIKRGQQVRRASQGANGADGEEVYEDVEPNPLQRCTAGMMDWWETMLAKCPCMNKAHHHLSEQEGLAHEMPKHGEVKLSSNMEGKLRELFAKMDKDHDNILSKSEAIEFWGKNFAKINAQAMFNEVDDDHNDTISIAEWLEFWQNVLGQDTYSEEDVMEEVESMLKGGSWVDWQDGRTT